MGARPQDALGAGAIVADYYARRAGDTWVEATELKGKEYQQVLLRELEAAVH